MPSNPYRSRRQIDKRLKRGNEMNTANRTSLETLLHWMEVNESGPHYAMSSALLAMGKASHHTQILYHFKHDEKADDVLSELQRSLNEEFNDSLSYGEDEVVFFTGESVSAGLSARKESTYLKINCTGEKNILNEIVNFIQSTGRTKKQPIVSRITKSTYGFEETELTLPEVVKSPTKYFYPFLEKDASEMWEDFYKSSANVMLFIGQAGTGKTSMIRAMLESRGYENKVHLVDNEMVLCCGVEATIRDIYTRTFRYEDEEGNDQHGCYLSYRMHEREWQALDIRHEDLQKLNGEISFQHKTMPKNIRIHDL